VKITLISDERLRIEGGAGPLTIEADSAEMVYSPYHMLASGLANCTFSVLHSWATNAKLPADDLAVEVTWKFTENPHRVGNMDVLVDWPSLPAERRAAAGRAATLCSVHKTLEHPPEMSIEVRQP
jgi:uncharacterized OsmC-like protein